MKPDSIPTTSRIMRSHPCFSDEAHDRVGRIHLPVAPRCNIRCNYCEHQVCSDIRHPGWTAKVLSVTEAVDLIESVMRRQQVPDFVVGVAGPGDALANDHTFQVLSLIRRRYPQVVTCLCTNGLLLEDKLAEISSAGVRALTVTVNACDSRVGGLIYSWVRYHGATCQGEQAADLLISRQFAGIEKAVAAGFAVKVNTVLIPGVNDRHIGELARRLGEVGVKVMNIMPLIPSGKMKGCMAPTCDELEKARQNCENILPQFHRCQQCRADVVFLPEKRLASV